MADLRAWLHAGLKMHRTLRRQHVRSVQSSPEGLDLAEPGATRDGDDLYHFTDDEGDDDDEEEGTEEQTNRFLEIFPAKPSSNQSQDNSNSEIQVIREDPR